MPKAGPWCLHMCAFIPNTQTKYEWMSLLRWAKQTYDQQTPAEDENEKVKHKREPPYKYEENPTNNRDMLWQQLKTE